MSLIAAEANSAFFEDLCATMSKTVKTIETKRTVVSAIDMPQVHKN